MTDEPMSPVQRRAAEMKAAQEEWHRASEELTSAFALFRDFSLTHESIDGNPALKNARLRESWTRQKYADALALYVEELRKSF